MRESRLLAHMPESLSFEEAAVIPTEQHRACVPRQGRPRAWKAHCRVRSVGSNRNGGRAAGESAGAYVTAVCNTKNVELVRSLGADEVVDYQKEDFRGTARPTT